MKQDLERVRSFTAVTSCETSAGRFVSALYHLTAEQSSEDRDITRRMDRLRIDPHFQPESNVLPIGLLLAVLLSVASLT
jgi:hypothetical protein